MPQADVERERQNSRYEQACEEFGAALDRLARAYAPQNAGKGGWSGPGPVVLAMLILVFFVFGRFVYLTIRKTGSIWPLFGGRTERDLSESCLRFYRTGLERQRRGYDAGPWDLFLLVPLFVVVFAPLLVRGALQPLPVVLIGICIVLAFLVRRREARRVRRELAALDAFERDKG